jgi:alpha-aminoadipate/glutamate carrier protein LysW
LTFGVISRKLAKPHLAFGSNKVLNAPRKEGGMPVCQECESVLDVDPDDVEEGDIVVCDECGTEFEVVATEPLQLTQVDQEGYEDEDEEVTNEEDE